MTTANDLAARLADYAAGNWDADDLPGIIRDALAGQAVTHDDAARALNAEADRIRDSHGYECADSIREDDRANLFTNVAGYMLTHDTAGMDDAAIVDTAIEDGYGEDAETVRGWSE